MKDRADLTHWGLQYALGLIVGGIIGAAAMAREEATPDLVLIVAAGGAAFLAGLASLWGDDAWYHLFSRHHDGAPASSSPYVRLEHNFWTRLVSWGSLLGGLALVALPVPEVWQGWF
jgi:hypothetical protein